MFLFQWDGWHYVALYFYCRFLIVLNKADINIYWKCSSDIEKYSSVRYQYYLICLGDISEEKIAVYYLVLLLSQKRGKKGSNTTYEMLKLLKFQMLYKHFFLSINFFSCWGKTWGPLEYQGGYQAHPKIHVIRFVFQDQAMYARTSFRGAKACKIGKKGVFLVIQTNFGKNMTGKLRKMHAKTCIQSLFSYLKNMWLGCFLWVHGRAWYPLLHSSGHPGEKWLTNAFCLILIVNLDEMYCFIEILVSNKTF